MDVQQLDDMRGTSMDSRSIYFNTSGKYLIKNNSQIGYFLT